MKTDFLKELLRFGIVLIHYTIFNTKETAWLDKVGELKIEFALLLNKYEP